MVIPVLLSIAAGCWLALLYVSTGKLLLRLIGWRSASALEAVVVAAGLGFGCIGNLVTLLNFLQLAFPKVIILNLALLSLLVFSRRIRSLKQFRRLPEVRMNRSEILTYLPLAVVLLLYFFRSLLPPSGFDALMYHLSCARLFLEHHGFYDIFFNTQSDYPMLSEMQYQIGLALGNDRVCRLIDFATGLIACGVLALFSFRCGLRHKGVVASCMLFLTMTVVIAACTNCDVDIAMAAWTGLAVYCAQRAREENTVAPLVVAALFTGMAMQTKIFGVFALPLAVVAAGGYRPREWKRTLILAGIPFLMALPWYAKAYLHTGSILSINGSLIEGQGLGLPMGVSTSSPLIRFLLHVPVRLLSAPWTFSLMPSQHQQDTLGPFLIALLPFALVVKTGAQQKRLLVLGLLYLAEVLVMELLFIPGGASIRYTLPIPLLLLPAGVVLVREIKNRMPNVGRVVVVLIAMQIILGGILLIKRYHRDWMALITCKNRVPYYESIKTTYPAIRYINSTPEVTGVLTTYNYDNYLIEKPYIAAFRHYADPEEFRADLQRYGVSHIFANDVFDTTSNRTAFSFLDGVTVAFRRNGYYVYDVGAAGEHTTRPEKATRARTAADP